MDRVRRLDALLDELLRTDQLDTVLTELKRTDRLEFVDTLATLMVDHAGWLDSVVAGLAHTSSVDVLTDDLIERIHQLDELVAQIERRIARPSPEP